MRSVVNDVSSASNAARSSVQRKGRTAITLVSFSGRRRTPQITGALGCPAIRGPLIARPFTRWLDASSGARQSFPHKHARHVSTRSESRHGVRVYEENSRSEEHTSELQSQ